MHGLALAGFYSKKQLYAIIQLFFAKRNVLQPGQTMHTSNLLRQLYCGSENTWTTSRAKNTILSGTFLTMGWISQLLLLIKEI